MSLLWDRTRTLPKEEFAKVKGVYQDNTLPLEVRLHLAAWIEEKFLPGNAFDMTDADFGQMAAAVSQEMVHQLDLQVDAIPNDPDKFLTKHRLQEISDNLKMACNSDPVSLYLNVMHCLNEEMKIVSEAPPSLSGMAIPPELADVGAPIRQRIAYLRQKVQETGEDLNRCKQELEAFSLEFYNCKQNQSRHEALLKQHGDLHPDVKTLKSIKEGLEVSVRQKFLNLSNHQSALTDSLVVLYENVKEVQVEVVDKELIEWKKNQQWAGNGYPVNQAHLDTLQEWCEGLADVIWTIRQQAKHLDAQQQKLSNAPQNKDSRLQELLVGITELLSNIVSGTFVVEKQPPQVMKTNTRFTATVRLLVGGVLNVHMVAPSVSVSIVSEHQANQLLTSQSSMNKRREDYNSGDILNSQGTMEYQQSTKQVSVSFRNLQLKKIRRTEKKGTESVMDEKFSVLFWTEFQVSELRFQLWTLSLPVVVIVHGNQEPQALATVVWDNGFAEWGRRPFYVPNKVTWGQAASALNMKWAAACGSPLTEDNLYYLACKALRNNAIPKIPDEYNNLILTWSLFCKDNLPDRNFTFWEWFYRILLLTSQHMQRLWKEGCIMGFVAKDMAEKMLLEKPNGTFLLRFSDSELGGVTIAYVRKPDPYSEPRIYSLFPFLTKDLSQRSMADVIFDLDLITTLYPDTPKEHLKRFSSSFSSQGSQSSNSNGYVKHMLVTKVEGTQSGGQGGLDSLPPSVGSYQADAKSPPNFGFDFDADGMEFTEAVDVDIADCIDVTQILGLTQEFMAGTSAGNY